MEPDHADDAIEHPGFAYLCLESRERTPVATELPHVSGKVGHACGPLSPVEQRDLIAPVDQHLGGWGADQTCPANDEYLHARLPAQQLSITGNGVGVNRSEATGSQPLCEHDPIPRNHHLTIGTDLRCE